MLFNHFLLRFRHSHVWFGHFNRSFRHWDVLNDEIAGANAETGTMNDETGNTLFLKTNAPPACSLFGVRTGGSRLWLFVFFGFHINFKINRGHITVFFLVDNEAAI